LATRLHRACTALSPSPPPAVPQLPAAAALLRLPAARGALRAVEGAYVRHVLMGSPRVVRCHVATLSEVMRERGVG
jgi:hypothetical protein